MIIVKLDVSKIDKTKLFKGAKGTYLDLVLMENRDGPDRYGNDFMVVQGVSKEDREKGVRGEILGNGKYAGQKPAGGAPQRQPDRDPSKSPYDRREPPKTHGGNGGLDEDVPFAPFGDCAC